MAADAKELEKICHQLIGLVDTSNEQEKNIDAKM